MQHGYEEDKAREDMCIQSFSNVTLGFGLGYIFLAMKIPLTNSSPFPVKHLSYGLEYNRFNNQNAPRMAKMK
jgi:hypothetical protein